jgi:hypothetical protein
VTPYLLCPAQEETVEGFFAFSLDAFSPASDITVVLIGSSGESSCTVPRLKLATLR